MRNRWLIALVAILLVAGVSQAAKQAKPKQGTWSGVVTDTHCGTKGHMGDAAACIKKCVDGGAKLALLTEGHVFMLDPQKKAAGHENHQVTVKGHLDGDTIHVTSIEIAQAKPAAKPAEKPAAKPAEKKKP